MLVRRGRSSWTNSACPLDARVVEVHVFTHREHHLYSAFVRGIFGQSRKAAVGTGLFGRVFS